MRCLCCRGEPVSLFTMWRFLSRTLLVSSFFSIFPLFLCSVCHSIHACSLSPRRRFCGGSIVLPPLINSRNAHRKATNDHTIRASNDARLDKSGHNKLSSHAFLFPFHFHHKRNPFNCDANSLTEFMYAPSTQCSAPNEIDVMQETGKKKHLFSIAIAVVFVAPLVVDKRASNGYVWPTKV